MRKIVIACIALVFIQHAQAQVGVNTENPETTLDVRALNHLGAVSPTDGVTVPRVSDLAAAGIANGQLVYLIADNGSFTKGFHYWDGAIWQPLDTNDGDAWGVNDEDITSDIVRNGKVTVQNASSSGGIGLSSPANNRAGLVEIIDPDGTRNGFIGWETGRIYYGADKDVHHFGPTNARVGINTANPTAKLDVNGSLRVRTMGNGSLTDNIISADVDGNIRKLNIESVKDGDAWGVSGEDITSSISRSGNVGIGTSNPLGILHTVGSVFHSNLTQAPTSSTHYMLSIDKSTKQVYYVPWGGIDPDSWGTGSAFDVAMDAWDGGANSTSGLMLSGQTSGHLLFNVIANDANDGFIFKNSNDDLVAKIWGTTGNLRIKGEAYKPGGGAWVAPSDMRIKKNVVDFEDGLSLINKLRPVKYQYNGKGGTTDNGNEYYGFIAQEVERVAPYMVTTIENEQGDIKDLKAVDETALTKILINAVQELSAEVESLKKEVAALKAQ